ncbi:MAG: tetratricopeptide repeat protein [Bacteroidales bacterium]|jgi:tetratricopeptide (TPR) repeat protein
MRKFFWLMLLVIVPFFAKAQVHDTIKQLPKYGNDSIQCITNLSLYRETYKQWRNNNYAPGQFDFSYKYWKWVFDNCPKASLNIYVDGVRIINDKIDRAETEEEKQAYIDTLMMVYDQRIVYFGDKGNVLSRKGTDLLKYRPDDKENIYKILSASVDEQKNETNDGVLMTLMVVAVDMFKNGLADESIIVENFEKLSEIADYHIENNKKPAEVEKYKNAKVGLESAFAPYASCEHLIPLYTKKFEENPDDEQNLKEIVYMLDRVGCNSSQLFEDVVVKFHELNPSPESAYMLGKMMFKKEDYNEAIKYLEQATKLENDTQLYEVYYVLAACHRLKNNFSKAREMAYKAAEKDPTNGEPYLFIGELYAQSSNMCSGSTPVEKLAVFWVAVDMFNKAKRVDASIADKANENIAIYSKYFPSSEEIFFQGLKVGDPYQVGCWINASTTIRASK